MATVKNIDVALRANVEKFEQGLKKGEGLVNQFVGKLGSMVAGFFAFSKASELAGRAMDKIAEQLQAVDSAAKKGSAIGIATGELLGLRYAIDRVTGGGVDIDRGLTRMIATIADADVKGGSAAKTIERLGLNVKTLARLSGGEQFDQIGKAVSKLGTAGEKTLAAQEIFGRAGRDMAAIWKDGGKELESYLKQAKDFNLTTSELDTAAILEFNDAMEDLEAMTTGFWRGMAADIAHASNALREFTGIDVLSFAKGLLGGLKQTVLGPLGQIADIGRKSAEAKMPIEGKATGMQEAKVAVAPTIDAKEMEKRGKKVAAAFQKQLQDAFRADSSMLGKLQSDLLPKPTAMQTYLKQIAEANGLWERGRIALVMRNRLIFAAEDAMKKTNLTKQIERSQAAMEQADAMRDRMMATIAQPVAGPAALERGSQGAFAAFQEGSGNAQREKDQLAVAKKMEAHLQKLARQGIVLSRARI